MLFIKLILLSRLGVLINSFCGGLLLACMACRHYNLLCNDTGINYVYVPWVITEEKKSHFDESNQ